MFPVKQHQIHSSFVFYYQFSNGINIEILTNDHSEIFYGRNAMFVSGFMGSPRKKGNTAYLLEQFLARFESLGATTETIHVPDKKIQPCTGCSLCEKKGYCCFEDDMQAEIFPIIRKSDIIVIASPIYFYNVPSELKALIDRSQTLWARKYKLRLKDPAEISRKGFMLSVGATKGSDLFDSINLTLKYFFKGIGADFAGELSYNRVEEQGDLAKVDSVFTDVDKVVTKLMDAFKKKTILFTCTHNTGRSQMAGAFARSLAGDRFNILTAGTNPAERIEPEIEAAMSEKGLDISFIRPEPIDIVTEGVRPDYIITLNSGDETCIHLPDSESIIWQIDDPADKPEDEIRRIRDRIEEKVRQFIAETD